MRVLGGGVCPGDGDWGGGPYHGMGARGGAGGGGEKWGPGGEAGEWGVPTLVWWFLEGDGNGGEMGVSTLVWGRGGQQRLLGSCVSLTPPPLSRCPPPRTPPEPIPPPGCGCGPWPGCWGCTATSSAGRSGSSSPTPVADDRQLSIIRPHTTTPLPPRSPLPPTLRTLPPARWTYRQVTDSCQSSSSRLSDPVD